MTGQSDQDADSKPLRPRLTIRELREAAQKETRAIQANKAAQGSQEARRKSSSTPQKKPSILGGLFQVREPTQIALNQVATQMIAQHGSTSATKVPNVRLEKMPDFVPKVNSKWDGVPESVKQRERREKEKEKERNKRETFFSTDSKDRSEDGKDKTRRNMGCRNSSSTTGSSFGAHGNSSGSQGASSRTRFYPQSINSSGDLASQQRTDASIFSPPLTSSSALSLTESLPDTLSNLRRGRSSVGTSSYCQHGKDMTTESRIPLDKGQLPPTCATFAGSTTMEYESLGSPAPSRYFGEGEGSSRLLAHVGFEFEPRLANAQMGISRSHSIPTAKSFPLQPILPLGSSQAPFSASPSPPQSLSPLRQGVNDMTSLQAALSLSEPGLLRPPALVKKKSGAKFNNAFLAGEAEELVLPDDVGHRGNADPAGQTSESCRSRIQQDLEKRPDSSRERLGLRASMLFSDDKTPWELRETTSPSPSSSPPAGHVPSTKTKFHKPFGRIGREKEKWKATV
ncbi:uncharacterized protein PV07_12103 [Cladophialophora immunda]|uniref:Uncharacterized protein n=1 Tax=Cladophialophora immunda TaxID=569365 RepID=A0A0D2ABN9_9EURO|nr:uncharacterized protein PV07_12103 [Cladophialophora immunda]KIW22192.1 hypothetical protein PV07_12103 [Cladophialophora immunda]